MPLFIQTGIGINFSRHSDSESESDEYYGYTVGYESKNSITQLGLNIPINLVYGVKINEQLAIKPYTGFYLRVNLMAKERKNSLLIFHQSLKTTLTEAITNTTKAITCSTKTT